MVPVGAWNAAVPLTVGDMSGSPERSSISERARSAAIAIETAGGAPPAPDDGGSYDWRDLKRRSLGKAMKGERGGDPGDGRVELHFLEEGHHGAYGRPWAMGRFAFDFVVGRGLRPEHRLLDFGCGALRIGLHAIDFLEENRYFGLEAHLKSLEAAVTYELPLHGLEHKRPRLLWDANYRVDHFGVTFDRILDFATTMHVPHDDLALVFERFAAVLAPGGRILTVPVPELSGELLERIGLRVVHREDQETPLLAGHRFSSTNEWVELAHLAA